VGLKNLISAARTTWMRKSLLANPFCPISEKKGKKEFNSPLESQHLTTWVSPHLRGDYEGLEQEMET